MWLLLSTLIVLAVFIYLKIYTPLVYWKQKRIAHVEPWPILGNMAFPVLRIKPMAQVLQDMYTKFSDHRYFGFYLFSMPSFVVRDLELIKQICIKDFDKFTDHTDILPTTSEPFWKKGLFARSGEDWHDMRTILSPVFTSSKMKSMFCLMTECAEEFVNHFQSAKEVITLEMRDTFTRFTNDVIASCAFGIKCDSLKERDNEFFLLGKDAFNFNGFRALKFFGNALSPTLMKLFKVTLFDEKMKNFFRKIVRETIAYRDQTGLVRPDMIHLLREAQKGRLVHEDSEKDVIDSGFAVVRETNIDKPKFYNKPEITDEDIATQAVVFFFGGFDTVAALMCNMAYELAIHPEIQERLIAEVDTTLRNCDSKITYESLLKMKYLDMVTSETLRLRSPAIFLNRKSVKPFKIEPVLAGEKPLLIEPGTDIIIPVYALLRDPKHFPDPERFDPERFSDENKHNIEQFSYLPFGTGPRSCIGNRFALLEAKTVIFFLLSRFRIIPVEKTAIPFSLSKTSIIHSSDKGYWLGLKPRT